MHCSQTGQLKIHTTGWQNEGRRWVQLLSIGWASSALLRAMCSSGHRKAKRWILHGTNTMATSNCDDSFPPWRNLTTKDLSKLVSRTSPRPQLHWMRDQCSMLCPSQERPAWAMPGTRRFTLAQRSAVLVIAWLWAGLAATYRVRVLELNTCHEHFPGEPQLCTEVKDTKHLLCNIQGKEVLQLLCSPVSWKQ